MSSPRELPAESDRALFLALRERDEAAFSELWERYADRLYRLAYRITRSGDDARDVVQETFIRVYQKIDSWDGRARLYSWIYRIAVNHSIDRLRSRQRRREHTESYRHDRALVHDSEVDAIIESHDQQALLERLGSAIDTLPEGQRVTLILRHHEGLSLKEIADIRGCALGTVKSTLFQAVRKLRSLMEEEQ